MDSSEPPGPSAPPLPSAPPGGRVLPLCATALVCAVCSAVLTGLVAAEWGPLLAFDTRVAAELHRSALAEPGWTRLSRLLTDWLWDPWTMRALLAGTVLWLLRRGERRLALWVAGTAAAGTLLQQGLRAVVGRERPSWPKPVDSAHFAALPSGHAMTAALAFALLLWVLRSRGVRLGLRRAVLWGGALSVAGVGFTRVYLGVHWPTDVVAGWLLGGTVAAVSAALWRARAAAAPCYRGAAEPEERPRGAARRRADRTGRPVGRGLVSGDPPLRPRP